MRIGILGSGLMGGKLGTLFARAGHDVVFSYARSHQKLDRLARRAGGHARAGTPTDAAAAADALLLAVHWRRVDDVLQRAGDWRECAIRESCDSIARVPFAAPQLRTVDRSSTCRTADRP